jgi:formyltetrahydrofolate deformylase
MDFRLTEAAKLKRVAIMAPKEDCLLDLLWRNRRGELDMSVLMVISNHPDQVRAFRDSVPARAGDQRHSSTSRTSSA